MKEKFDCAKRREEQLLRQALNDLAAEELRAARRDETLDAEYERTLPGVRRYVSAMAADRRRCGRRRLRTGMMLAAALTLLAAFGVCVAGAILPERFLDDDAVTDGIVSRKEVYEATCTVDFLLDAQGNLEMYQFVMENPRGIQDDAYGNSAKESAVTWTAKITYLKHRTAQRDTAGELAEQISYVPVAFAQSVTVHDDRVALCDMRIEGGACGTAYDINDGFRRIVASLTTEDWCVERAESGAWYQESYHNPGYAFVLDDGDGQEAQVSTRGTFTYCWLDDPEKSVKQTDVCCLELLDWWKP